MSRTTHPTKNIQTNEKRLFLCLTDLWDTDVKSKSTLVEPRAKRS